MKLLTRYVRYWWLFLICIAVTLSIAFIYLRYSSPLYKINAKLLIKDDKKGGGMDMSDIFSDLGISSKANSTENEVEVLKSRTLMENTVKALQLNVKYFAKGSVKMSEVYKENLPFDLSVTDIVEDSLIKEHAFTFTEVNRTKFTLNDGINEKTHTYNDTISSPSFRMVFKAKPATSSSFIRTLIIKINKTDDAVSNFQTAFAVAPTSKTVSTIDLSLTDNIPKRGEDILNTLIYIYNITNREDKNRIADSTIDFIDNRLVYVTSELGDVERKIESFKRKNKLTDLSVQGQLLLKSTKEGDEQLAQQEVQIAVVNSLQKYLSDDKNNLKTIPAGLAVPDPTFASLIENYNRSQLERARQLQTTTENNPIVQTLNVQINNLKSSIIANLATIKSTMKINRNQLTKGSNSFERQIEQVPQKERTFLEFSRQQSIKQELYLYLLKKREETAVSKSANVVSARIIDPAKSERAPFTPKPNFLYFLAVLAGLLLPVAFIYGRSIFVNTIESKNDIANLTAAPIVAEIGRSKEKDSVIIKENSRSAIAEQFRLLRTNLDYMVPASGLSRTILITSSMSGEGKSFLSLNLAATISLTGKKVVLLEFDLRKPKLSSYLNLSNNEGISSYLVKRTGKIQSIIKQIPGFPNLYFLPSGPIPPNPAELINGPYTQEMLSHLKAEYDHIIIDVPPVGVVADTFLLAPYADISLYVIRQSYTYRNQMNLVNDVYQQGRLPNMGLVVNDIKTQNSYSGYGYGYEYGYGYFEKETKKGSGLLK